MSLRDEIEEMIRERAPESSLARDWDDAANDATGDFVALKAYCDALRAASLRLAEELDVLLGTLRR